MCPEHESPRLQNDTQPPDPHEPVNVEQLSREEITRIYQELSVYKAELEAQNDELRSQQALIQQLNEVAPIGLLVMSPTGILLDANQTLCEMLCCDKQDILRQATVHIISKESWKEFFLFQERLEQSDNMEHGRIELIDTGGQAIPCEMRGKRMLHHGKEPTFNIAITDLRELTQALDRAEASTTKQDSIQHQLNENQSTLEGVISILKHDPEPEQDFLDHALNEVLKVTGSQIGYIYHYSETRKQFELSTWSKGVMDLCSVMNPQTCYELKNTGIWGEAVRQRKPIILNEFQAHHPLKKGLPKGHAPLKRYMTIPIFYDEAIVAVIGVANKLTEYTQDDTERLRMLGDAAFEVLRRKKAEQEYSALRRNAERYMNIANVMIVALDRYGRITFLNQRAISVLGATLDELQGRDWFHLAIPEDERESVRAVFRQLMAGDVDPVEFHENNILTGNDKTILVEWHNSLQYDSTGAITGIVSSGEDISEKRELQERVAQAEKMDAIGHLAGGVAHDFNNQLSGILGYADMLANQLTDPKMKRYAESILSGAHRAADLTQQLLAFARKGKYQKCEVDLHSLAHEVVELLSHTLDRSITVQQHLDAPNARVLADPTLLQNMLLNLAINARDAMPDGGELIIKTSTITLTEKQAEAEPFNITPGNFVLLSIHDSGCGMNKETLEHAFEPFFTTKEQGKGTGMGLAAVYGTVTNHDGCIHIYSEPGLGTNVNIYLPAMQSQMTPQAQGDSTIMHGSGTILVIDDEDIFRDLSTDMLSELGYTVVAAPDGKAAGEYLASHADEVDLVILDMIMPILNGPETYKLLRGIAPTVPVLLASGFSINEKVQSLLNEGAAGFLQKPFHHEALAKAVADALNEKSAP